MSEEKYWIITVNSDGFLQYLDENHRWRADITKAKRFINKPDLADMFSVSGSLDLLTSKFKLKAVRSDMIMLL